jgi:hypothetical protein
MIGCTSLSAEDRADLGNFLKTSVTVGTARTYDSQWYGWCEFIKNLEWGKDPYMREELECDKAALVASYLQKRYNEGARGKGATSVTAGLRLSFTSALIPCHFLESAIVSTARAACKPSTEELREKRNEGTSTTVKLPFCESILTRMRGRLWESGGWDRSGLDSKMVYLACMWAYDMDA